MPELPEQMKPRNIYVIDALYELGQTKDEVRVVISVKNLILQPQVLLN